jgi:hypothetical protein
MATRKPKVKPRDLLTTIPSEILLKIISQVPTKGFLDLVQTCRTLRNFVKINASRICNEAILTRFPLKSKLLQSTKVSEWLVPAHMLLTMGEARFRWCELQNHPLMLNAQKKKHFSLLGQLTRDLTIPLQITSPGPQYLHFLESGILLVSKEYLSQRFDPVEAVVDGQRYFFTINDRNNREPVEPLATFLYKFNKVKLLVKDGELQVPKNNDGKFPRELVWFYGVERLRILGGKETEDDWKSLPKLLWD